MDKGRGLGNGTDNGLEMECKRSVCGNEGRARPASCRMSMKTMVPAKIFMHVGRRTLEGTGIIFGERREDAGDDNGERNLSTRSLGKDIRLLCGLPNKAVNCFLTMASCFQCEPGSYIWYAFGLARYAHPSSELLCAARHRMCL